MSNSSEFLIPVPAWFRTPPLVKLPWGLTSIPKLIKCSEDTEINLREKIKKSYGVKYCILTESARSAYSIFLKATQLDGEIIMQSMMHTPTAVLLSNHGLELVFCDINNDFCMSPEHIKTLVSSKTRSVLVTHMFGKTAPIDRIEEWARERSLLVLSNMVHMPGNVTLNNKSLASYGDAAFLSFNMDKPLQSIYGGALLTNSDEIYEKCQSIKMITPSTMAIMLIIFRYLLLYRYKPLTSIPQYLYYLIKNEYYKNSDVEKTFNSFSPDNYKYFSPKKIHPWQAAFACKLIDNLEEIVTQRKEHATKTIQLLSSIPELTLPEIDDRPHTFQYFPVILPKSTSRYDLGVSLSKYGIETKWRYYPLHLQDKFANCRTGNLENTLDIWGRYLLLPTLYAPYRKIEMITRQLQTLIHDNKG